MYLDSLTQDIRKKSNESVSQWLDEAQNILRHELLRFIPIDTSTLNFIIRLKFDEAKKALVHELRSNLKMMDFELINQEAVERGLEEDILNDDIPIFYQQPSTGYVFYYRVIIATKVHR